MAQITAVMVKELRTKTGAGMMDCKKALTDCDGDVGKAVDWLRKKGLAAAAKKAGRVAAEGLIATVQEGGRGIVIELNAETDFISRNDQFQDLARTIATVALEVGADLAKLNAADYPGTGRTVAEELTNAIATVGENMNLRRAAEVSATPGVVASYMHNAVAPGLGKIGVLVALQSDGDSEKLFAFGKQIAMHVAASNPSSVSVGDLDASTVDRERAILSDQARASGKPENIIEKMVEGRLRKYYQEVVLLEQTFVIDTDNTVREALEIAAKDIGDAVEIVGFVRFALGEGIEREESDFAAEVAASAAG